MTAARTVPAEGPSTPPDRSRGRSGSFARRGAKRVGSVVGSAGSGIVRDFIWADLRSGIIRLKGLSAAMRTICITAMLSCFGLMAVFIANESIRNRSGLMLISTSQGRGLLVPSFLVPTACFTLAFGAALVLAGALHAPRLLRVVTLVVYAGIADDVRRGTRYLETYGTLDKVLGWVAIGGVATVFLVRWRARPRPVGEFLALFACTSLTFLNIQAGLVGSHGRAGDPFVVYQLNLSLTDMAFIATPLLLVAGLDAIGFGTTVSRWTVDFLEDRVHRLAVVACLVALAAWRAHDVVGDVAHAIGHSAGEATRGYLDGALVVAILGGCWLLIDRIADRATGQEREDGDVGWAASRVGLIIAAVIVGVAIVPSLFVLLSNLADSVLPGNRRLDGPAIRVLSWVGRDGRSTEWALFAGIGILGVAIALARRGRRPEAHYLAVVAAWVITQTALEVAHWLRFLSLDDYGQLDLWWTGLLLGTTVWWGARRELTAVRAGRLLFLFVLTALFRQQDFLSNPFAIVLRFTGVGLVVFGLVWGFLTAGDWCNAETSRLHRSGRIMVFLGYELFSLTLLCWFTLTHDLGWRDRLTNELPSQGLQLLGVPLLFALAAVTYAGAVADRAFDDDLADPEAQPSPATAAVVADTSNASSADRTTDVPEDR